MPGIDKSKCEMSDFAIVIHGGSGPRTDFIRKHISAYEKSLARICTEAYNSLKQRTAALDAVFEVLAMLEDDPLFNAGRGSALNEHGVVEMDAAVMEGKYFKTGAVACLKKVKNPSALVKEILKHTNSVFIGAEGALELASKKNIEQMPDSYFITEHQVEAYLEKQDSENFVQKLLKRVHGTVGVAVLDKMGTIAAGTSSGGTVNNLSGRIGDSCVIGSGCYANNNTCAVSASGDGEYLIQGVVAHSVSSYLEYNPGTSVQRACDHVVHYKNKGIKGDLGLVGIDPRGNIGIAFNSERMHRAWIGNDGKLHVKNYINS
jgi:L-asparaginase / beta-aspartyl-peptidase